MAYMKNTWERRLISTAKKNENVSHGHVVALSLEMEIAQSNDDVRMLTASQEIAVFAHAQ